MTNEDKLRCARALREVAAYRRGELTFRDVIMRLPSQAELEDEDLSELVDLIEHEPGRGISPSGKRAYADWERALNDVLQRMTAKVSST